jgi:hypothetical protein
MLPLFAAMMGFAVGGSFVWAIDQPKYEQHISNAETHATGSADQHQPAKTFGQRLSAIWERTWDDPVAFYTFVLGIFTALLAFISLIQIGFLFRTDKTSRIAANAADLNARAAIGMKLPSIHASLIELYEPGPPYGKIGDHYKFRIHAGRVKKNSQVSITFANIGETNARIVGICFEYFVGGRLPKQPTYKHLIPYTETAIKADGIFVFRPANFHIVLSPVEDQALDLILANHFWLYGYLSYVDFMNTPHEYRFCQRWITTSILGSPTGFFPEFYIAKEYTQSY